jgi:hypothetical protein
MPEEDEKERKNITIKANWKNRTGKILLEKHKI